ncbi:gamma-crystallin 1 [Xenopus laevis]|uniref:Gamma-crystallin 1 n=2 Tax=Xenopus laevis TaxID=8355 RepID=A0A1L8EPU0_XENLA|nr:gamma-crystallin 1 [Xenopus laevis]OCT61364.1 hypothetical protein XELAEV_18047387mg [Xenopus laevis]
MGKITFFEDKNFKGHSFECNSDNNDLQSHFSRCNSIKVDNGSWMIYEHANNKGHQYFLKQGEYPDYQHWMGFNDSISSCRMIPQYTGSFLIKVYEKEDFRGQMLEFIEDCSHVFQEFNNHEIHSCNVIEGHWIFYEESNYRGRQYYLRPGEYRRFNDWGASNAKVGSFRKVMDLY